MGEPSMTNDLKKIITKDHGCCLGVRDQNFPIQIMPFGLGCDIPFKGMGGVERSPGKDCSRGNESQLHELLRLPRNLKQNFV